MRMKISLNSSLLALCVALSCAAPARAQSGVAPVRAAQNGAGQPYDDRVRGLLARADVRAAFADVERDRDRILREWIAITEINAPSGKEAERAAFIEKILRGHGSLQVSRDP